MNLKIALSGRARTPIHNNTTLPEQKTANSEIKTYFLTPEELGKYKKSDKESEKTVGKKTKEVKPQIDISTHAVPYCGAKPVDVEKYFVQKFSVEQEEIAGLNKELREWRKEDAPDNLTPELEYADNYKVEFNDELDFECSTMDEAILHIKTRHNLLTVGQVRLYKEIPFSMQVNVVVGK